MTVKEIHVPDIGDFSDVEIIEVLVAPGDEVTKEDSLITVESDKSSIEIPSPLTGAIRKLEVNLGDRVSQGDLILSLETGGQGAAVVLGDLSVESSTMSTLSVKSSATTAAVESPAAHRTLSNQSSESVPMVSPASRSSPTAHMSGERIKKAHASPSVRRFARELGADLNEIKGSGPKGRILKKDIQEYIKKVLVQGGTGFRVAELPEVDFAKFGEVETQALSRINKLTGVNLHRNWVRIPHVTQYDQADITELEDFRKSLNKEYRDKGIKITLLSFLMKAVVSALKENPRFNSSLDDAQENLILKRYYHVGVAVDTPGGLVVPVVREVDRKSLVEVASELGILSAKAREGRLSPADLQGGCFTISSLGGIGGTSFTPIVNAPEVAILGVSRATMQPVHEKDGFVSRLILPLSLSYDHRVIDGAAGARFTTFLSAMLSDTRRLLL
ncbi:MAG: dihydrolipoyllysine-residue acetyltransferase [Gammaproteobacteria bacterium]|nr:dihydrolipoyllysine-residue acetyltransferase [Gammaproteobacteria bacterium]